MGNIHEDSFTSLFVLFIYGPSRPGSEYAHSGRLPHVSGWKRLEHAGESVTGEYKFGFLRGKFGREHADSSGFRFLSH